MTRLGKFMVYNPKQDKPIKFYRDYSQALRDSIILRTKENTDILVLEVVAIADTKSKNYFGIKSKQDILMELEVE